MAPSGTGVGKDSKRNKVSSSSLNIPKYGISLEELKKLMECRGNDGYFLIKEKFENVEGVCKKLNTDPIKGELAVVFILALCC